MFVYMENALSPSIFLPKSGRESRYPRVGPLRNILAPK